MNFLDILGNLGPKTLEDSGVACHGFNIGQSSSEVKTVVEEAYRWIVLWLWPVIFFITIGGAPIVVFFTFIDVNNKKKVLLLKPHIGGLLILTTHTYLEVQLVNVHAMILWHTPYAVVVAVTLVVLEGSCANFLTLREHVPDCFVQIWPIVYKLEKGCTKEAHNLGGIGSPWKKRNHTTKLHQEWRELEMRGFEGPCNQQGHNNSPNYCCGRVSALLACAKLKALCAGYPGRNMIPPPYQYMKP
ncbi:hypothetical protein CsSME_00001069 [Camellia sinensis var. sinensis]